MINERKYFNFLYGVNDPEMPSTKFVRVIARVPYFMGFSIWREPPHHHFALPGGSESLKYLLNSISCSRSLRKSLAPSDLNGDLF